MLEEHGNFWRQLRQQVVGHECRKQGCHCRVRVTPHPTGVWPGRADKTYCVDLSNREGPTEGGQHEDACGQFFLGFYFLPVFSPSSIYKCFVAIKTIWHKSDLT
jgi:hypothetical protein